MECSIVPGGKRCWEHGDEHKGYSEHEGLSGLPPPHNSQGRRGDFGSFFEIRPASVATSAI